MKIEEKTRFREKKYAGAKKTIRNRSGKVKMKFDYLTIPDYYKAIKVRKRQTKRYKR